MLSRVDLFENTVFMLLCGWMKTKLFENANVTASIYYTSEQAIGVFRDNGMAFCLRILLSKFEHRILNVTTLRVDGGIFENAPSANADMFYAEKKRCAFEDIPICADVALAKVKISQLWFGRGGGFELSRLSYQLSKHQY